MSESVQTTFQQVADLYLKQSSSLDQTWQFYWTVSAALLTAVVASDKMKATPRTIRIAIAGYIGFAAANLGVILNSHCLVIQLADLGNKLAVSAALPSAVALNYFPQWAIAVFHLFADAFFVMGMWFSYRAVHTSEPVAPVLG